jgi:hypothetical protein
VIIPSRSRALPLAIAAAAVGAGAIVAFYYHQLGLTLSHYDARGHLIVARRVFDSITPGWQQVGAVWLPLPHLLNLVPVQIDFFYRTGASAVAISVMAYGLATGAIAWVVLRLTGCAPAALVAAAAFALNPNMLYLQATPMTEPLLIALTVGAVALLMRWSRDVGRTRLASEPGLTPEPSAALVGAAFALACLTRYEAWPVTAVALTIAVWVRWRNGDTMVEACRRVGHIGAYPAVALVVFAIYSRVVVGEWFTASGFFVPENKALDRPLTALAEIWWGAHALSGTLTIAIAAIGLCGLIVQSTLRSGRADALITLSLVATAALPWAAFVKGHPFRIRYMVPLLAVEAIGVGAAIGLTRRAAPVAAALVALAFAYAMRPLDASAPMVLEAQWDRPNVRARRLVTDCVRAKYDGGTIMASMGSLGHYMQEMASDGFALHNFLHEGNGDIWLAALEHPRPYAAWIMIEEKAEGGDMLAQIARAHPAFLEEYVRVCEGAGVALYRRTAPSPGP